jgi:hypothetical protein
MLQGHWDEVVCEGDEDITCTKRNPPRCWYRQVKTVEDPRRLWSPAMLCQSETGGNIQTSVLGRLFTVKPMPDDARFVLVLNENVNDDLRSLVVRDRASRHQESPELLKHLEERLAELAPAGNRSIRWCLERLHIEVRGRTIEDVENKARSRVNDLCREIRTYALLMDEVEDILVDLLGVVAASSKAEEPIPLTSAFFKERVVSSVERRAGMLLDGTMSAPEAIGEKLDKAQLTSSEIQHAREMHLTFAGWCRQAVGDRKQLLIALTDSVFMACQGVSADRRSGIISDGLPAYKATLGAVRRAFDEENFGARGATMSEAWAALANITARCRHRYVG